jgi:hypothetical protein
MAPLTTWAVVKRDWRRFLPMWLFPIGFLSTALLPGVASHPLEYLFLLDFPLLILCGYPALYGWRHRGITFGQMFVLFAIVPFLIWTALIFGALGFAVVVGV